MTFCNFGDQEEAVPGAQVVGAGVVLGLGLLLHHVQLPGALLHLQAALLLHLLAGVHHVVGKVAQGVDG